MQRLPAFLLLVLLTIHLLPAQETDTPPKPEKLILGAVLVPRKTGCKVQALVELGPAYKAGLRPGDYILKVNDQTAVGIDTIEIARLISQKNPVTLQIRDTAGKTKTLTVTKVPKSAFADPKGRIPITAPYDPLDELKVGDLVPDFTALYPDERQVKLSDSRGYVVVVIFWAAWNDSSIPDISTLRDLYYKYYALGLDLLGVNLDTDKLQLDKTLVDLKIMWPQHFDGRSLDGGVVMEWGVTALPVVALVGRDGKLIAENLHGKELEAAVKTALGLEASYGEGPPTPNTKSVIRRPRIILPPPGSTVIESTDTSSAPVRVIRRPRIVAPPSTADDVAIPATPAIFPPPKPPQMLLPDPTPNTPAPAPEK